ncbi:hypothetical protein FHR92_004680 [Fontibacillus solani]|uniref:HXXEE domain-containing protein n=1 Tax=Fontibacillus solani TaxID=1572857 RepID=A0A7W3SXY0_9BACL|nr:HXXEE domain-containing protein [Fontibacillus solani]MBA9088184.1 hypothetical protein [Fontibacillus solani]
MIEFLNDHINLVSLLWLFPITFMFHDFEEIITVEKWIERHGDHVKSSMPRFAQKLYNSSFRVNTLHFAKDVLWVYSLIVTVTVLAVFFQFYLPFLATLHVYFFHVFTHVGQSIFLKKYTPGVMTAVIPVLPYSLYAYYRLFSDGVVTSQDLTWSLILMVILLPVALTLLIKGRKGYLTS